MPRRARQLELPRTCTWGGARRGAGRRPPEYRAPVQHRRRIEHRAAFPVHITLRARADLSSLRQQKTFTVIRRALTASSNARFRVLHFSVQDDHLHLLVEANDTNALALGVAGIKIRLARAINRLLARRGPVWAGRYHARSLRTPREVRAGLVYVLQNWKKHRRNTQGLDGCSSAVWFDGWAERPVPPGGPRPVAAPRTWLAAIGWRRCTAGPLRTDEAPTPYAPRKPSPQLGARLPDGHDL